MTKLKCTPKFCFLRNLQKHFVPTHSFFLPPSRSPQGLAITRGAGLADAYDDPEGYYNFSVGEVLDQRYQVFATHGRGVFSTVLRARDLGQEGPVEGAHPEVAIKARERGRSRVFGISPGRVKAVLRSCFLELLTSNVRLTIHLSRLHFPSHPLRR